MDPENIKDKAIMLHRLNHFIKDVLYGSILNFHVQLYKETNGNIDAIGSPNALCLQYVAGYLTRYFNGGISKWIKDENQENHFRAQVLPIKGVINHGYGCFLNFLILFCTQALMQLDLSKVKFDPEKMDFDTLNEEIDKILESQKDVYISAFSHTCLRHDDIKDWDPEKTYFGIKDPENPEEGKDAGEVWNFQKVVKEN